MGSSISGEALCYSNTGAQALSEGNYNRATRSSLFCSTFNQDPRGRLKIKTDRWFIGIACVVCAGLQLPASSLHRVIGTWQVDFSFLDNALSRFYVPKQSFRVFLATFLVLVTFFWIIAMMDWGSKVAKQSNVPFITATEVRTHGFIRFFNTAISSFSVNIFSFKFS